MQRLIDAFRNSVRAAGYLARKEAAFRQEMLLLLVALPAGWVLAPSWRGYALLIASVLLIVLVEVLNTAIEAACNAVSREFNADIGLAKDCGSLAVLMAIALALAVWVLALVEWVGGVPV